VSPTSKLGVALILLAGCATEPPEKAQEAPAERFAEAEPANPPAQAAPQTTAKPSAAPTPAAAPASVASPTPEAPPAPTPAANAPAVEVLSIRRAPGLVLKDALDRELATAEAKEQRVVVMFSADWCVPCRSIKEALESNPIVQGHTRGGRFLIIDVDEWRGPAHRLIEGADPSKLPLLVALDRQGQALVMTHGSKIGLLDPETTGQNLARVIHGQEIVLPTYQDDPKRRRALAIADSRRQKSMVENRTPVTLKVTARETLSDKRERLTVDLVLNNNEAGRRYWILPTHVAPAEGPIEVPQLSGARFKEHVRAGFFIYATDPPTHVIASGNWGSVDLKGYTVEVPEGTKELQVHLLNSVTVAGERLNFTKKVPYALKIEEASNVVPGRTLDEPRTLVFDVKQTYKVAVGP